MGEIDYDLWAIKNGCQIQVSPGYFGAWTNNDNSGLWIDGWELAPLCTIETITWTERFAVGGMEGVCLLA